MANAKSYRRWQHKHIAGLATLTTTKENSRLKTNLLKSSSFNFSVFWDAISETSVNIVLFHYHRNMLAREEINSRRTGPMTLAKKISAKRGESWRQFFCEKGKNQLPNINLPIFGFPRDSQALVMWPKRRWNEKSVHTLPRRLSLLRRARAVKMCRRRKNIKRKYPTMILA